MQEAGICQDPVNLEKLVKSVRFESHPYLFLVMLSLILAFFPFFFFFLIKTVKVTGAYLIKDEVKKKTRGYI